MRTKTFPLFISFIFFEGDIFLVRSQLTPYEVIANSSNILQTNNSIALRLIFPIRKIFSNSLCYIYKGN